MKFTRVLWGSKCCVWCMKCISIFPTARVYISSSQKVVYQLSSLVYHLNIIINLTYLYEKNKATIECTECNVWYLYITTRNHENKSNPFWWISYFSLSNAIYLGIYIYTISTFCICYCRKPQLPKKKYFTTTSNITFFLPEIVLEQIRNRNVVFNTYFQRTIRAFFCFHWP